MTVPTALASALVAPLMGAAESHTIRATRHAVIRWAERVRSLDPSYCPAVESQMLACLAAAEITTEPPAWCLTTRPGCIYLLAGSIVAPAYISGGVIHVMTVITPDCLGSPAAERRRANRRRRAAERAERERRGNRGPTPKQLFRELRTGRMEAVM